MPVGKQLHIDSGQAMIEVWSRMRTCRWSWLFFCGGVSADADYRGDLVRDFISQPGSVNNPFVAAGETNISFADGHVAGFLE